MDCCKTGKGVYEGCILSPCLFNLYVKYMWNARLDEAQAGIKIAGRNINILRYANNTTLVAKCALELKSLLMKVKEKSEKAGLKQHSKNEVHLIQSYHFMANRWGTMETVTYFIFLGSKITVKGGYRYKIKRLAPWKNSCDKPRQHIKKQRDHFTNNGLYMLWFFR